MSEFGGLRKHENNQHVRVPPKTECGCPNGGIKNGYIRYPSYGGTQKKKENKGCTHPWTFVRTACKADYRLHSLPRTAREWNALLPEVVPSPSLGAFIAKVSANSVVTLQSTPVSLFSPVLFFQFLSFFAPPAICQ